MDKVKDFYEAHRKACNVALGILIVYAIGFAVGIGFK